MMYIDRRKLKHYSIRQLRDIVGMSQNQFSLYLGIPRRTIQEWEGERRVPPSYVKEMIEIIICYEFYNQYKYYPLRENNARKRFVRLLKSIRNKACQVGTQRKENRL